MKYHSLDSFGICHDYNEEGEEENFTIRDNSLHMLPRGYHMVVSAPGYTTYYLWFLAGAVIPIDGGFSAFSGV